MIIKDPKFGDYYVVADYRGYHLFDGRQKSGECLMRNVSDMGPVVQDIAKRMIGECSDEVTVDQYNAKVKSIVEQVGLSIPVPEKNTNPLTPNVQQ